MSSYIKQAVTFITLSLFSLNAYADLNAYGDRSNSVKGRIGYLDLKTSIKNGSAGSTSKQKMKGGLVGEVALTKFFTSNIATEIGIGYSFIKIRANPSNPIAGTKYKNSNIIPLSGTLQFHLPIKKMFVPYVGAGYTYHIFRHTNTSFKINKAGNLVYQAGIDLFVLDDLGLNFDCKYAKVNHKISDNGERFKAKFTTVTTMFGVTIPF